MHRFIIDLFFNGTNALFNDWLIGWLTGWLIDWLIGWLIDWLTGWLIDLLINRAKLIDCHAYLLECLNGEEKFNSMILYIALRDD